MFAHIRAYAIRPYTCSVESRASLGKNTITNRPIQSSNYHRINGKYVGAYCIRPPWRRTYQRKSLAQNEASFSNTFAAVVFIFAYIRAYAIRPYSLWRIINYHDALTAARMLIKWWCFVRRHHFISAHIRAYAIRPYGYRRIINNGCRCDRQGRFRRLPA